MGGSEKNGRRLIFFVKFLNMSHLGESNSGPMRYECIALPTELRWQKLKQFNNITI